MKLWSQACVGALWRNVKLLNKLLPKPVESEAKTFFFNAKKTSSPDKTAATPGFRLISLEADIIYKFQITLSAPWSSYVVFKGSFLLSSQLKRTLTSSLTLKLAENTSDESFSRWISNILDLEAQWFSCIARLVTPSQLDANCIHYLKNKSPRQNCDLRGIKSLWSAHTLFTG